MHFSMSASSSRLFSLLVALIAILGTESRSHAQYGNPYVKVDSPYIMQLTGGPSVAVSMSFLSPDVDPSKVGVFLNNQNVTSRFVFSPLAGTGFVSAADGLVSTPFYGPGSGAVNVLTVMCLPRVGPGVLATYVVQFRYDPSAIPNAIGVIQPGGGTLTLPGVGSVFFPNGTFGENTLVALLSTNTPDTAQTFAETAPLFNVHGRVGTEFRVLVGTRQPNGPVTVNLIVPAAFQATLTAQDELRVLGENLFDDGSEFHDSFDLFTERHPRTAGIVTVAVPEWFFSNAARSDGRFEAVLVLSATPTVAPTLPSPISTPPSVGEAATLPPLDSFPGVLPQFAFGAGGRMCDGSPLGAPLSGTLNETSMFGSRIDPITGVRAGHGGTDLQAASNTDVLAMSDGVIEVVGFQTKLVNGHTRGWGRYVVLKHTNSQGQEVGRTLYAHLTDGSPLPANSHVTRGTVIARSGATGGVTGPHLHIEYAPSGSIFLADNKRDPFPCIGQNVTGGITVGDNGSIADDAFSVAINGVVVCSTTIGATNTCGVNNLRPGTSTLTITCVIAPDNVGTYGISLSNGLTFQGGGTSRSGTLPQGGSASFMIVIPSPP